MRSGIRKLPTIRRVRRGLTTDQNDRVQRLLNELLRDTTQVAIRETTGISQSNLSRIANGQGTSFAVAEKLAALKGVSVWSVLGIDTAPNELPPTPKGTHRRTREAAIENVAVTRERMIGLAKRLGAPGPVFEALAVASPGRAEVVDPVWWAETLVTAWLRTMAAAPVVAATPRPHRMDQRARVRIARDLRGMPVQDLAALGYSDGSERVRSTALPKLAAVLRVRPEWLETGEGAAIPDDERLDPSLSPHPSFSARLQFLRLLRGWSQRDLAERARTSAGQVGDVEAGRTIGADTLANIVKALNVNETWIGKPEPSVRDLPGVERKPRRSA
jgi:DNA-binding Xre family transcriptional regulator